MRRIRESCCMSSHGQTSAFRNVLQRSDQTKPLTITAQWQPGLFNKPMRKASRRKVDQIGQLLPAISGFAQGFKDKLQPWIDYRQIGEIKKLANRICCAEISGVANSLCRVEMFCASIGKMFVAALNTCVSSDKASR